VPKLWTETIEAHRHAVHDAILETTAALVAEDGVRAVTMSQIAEQTGIVRATLYKYFPDVETILLAWHERQITAHLQRLGEIRNGPGEAGERLESVLEAYALIQHELGTQQGSGRIGHGSDLAGMLHRGEHAARAQDHLEHFMKGLLTEAAKAGAVRGDVPPRELAGYCIHTLRAAGGLSTKAAVRRLVAVTLAGLRPAR
jgi:AcrR family transcriptional regulator